MAGQVNRQSFLGEYIYHLALKKEFTTFVEVGTWNGEGSTKCFMDGILSRLDESCLYSIEANIEFYNQALKYWQPTLSTLRFPFPKLHILYGRLIETEELTSEEEIRNHKIFHKQPWLTWRSRNIEEYGQCENIINKIPDGIDVLFLDGGQFSTLAEWNRLKSRTKVVLLDDTTTFKTEKIREEIMEDSANWTVVFDTIDDRNGIFMACQTEFLHIVKNHKI
jgi:hypothetical protein